MSPTARILSSTKTLVLLIVLFEANTSTPLTVVLWNNPSHLLDIKNVCNKIPLINTSNCLLSLDVLVVIVVVAPTVLVVISDCVENVTAPVVKLCSLNVWPTPIMYMSCDPARAVVLVPSLCLVVIASRLVGPA